MFNLTFNLANFINTVLGAFLGGLISLVVSYYFFIKGSGLETLMKWLSHNLGDSYIRQQHPQFFGPQAFVPSVSPQGPDNFDIPRIQTVIFPSNTVTAGQTQEILCRVVDEGWNFPSTNGGLVITDHTGVVHQVIGIGYGYMYANVRIPTSTSPGQYILTFEMHDIDKSTQKQLNSFTQKVQVQVV